MRWAVNHVYVAQRRLPALVLVIPISIGEQQAAMALAALQQDTIRKDGEHRLPSHSSIPCRIEDHRGPNELGRQQWQMALLSMSKGA